jgi:hypothetical protein
VSGILESPEATHFLDQVEVGFTNASRTLGRRLLNWIETTISARSRMVFAARADPAITLSL